MEVMTLQEKARRNGNVDGIFNLPCKVNEHSAWREKTEYLSGYLEGQEEYYRQRDKTA